MSPVIDLDNNATTRPSPGVVAAVAAALTEHWHNPSSVHRAGQAARRRVELARKSIADLIGARPREITFTSGGTEAIDLALRGTLARLPAERRTLVSTRIEHAAVRDLAAELEKNGAPVRWLPLGPGGLIDPAAVAGTLGGAGLVSVQWANNETGVVQAVREIGAACRAAGTVFHCDATQWVGKMETDVTPGWCDLLTFSAHKFHGPKGVGVLWARPGVTLRPTLAGTQETGRRGGTENVPGIVGAGVAAEEARAWLARPGERERLAALRDEFEGTVLAAIPDAVVNGQPAARIPKAESVARLWNTTNIGFPRLEAEALILLLSERAVNASAGAACSSGSLEPSPVLLAMGVPPEVAHGSVRFSLSRESTQADIQAAARIVVESVEVLRRALPA